jgi:ParB-like chromosome segregation protein Spo0J
MQTVQIRCKAAVNLDLANLTPLQGDLKELSESNFNKLKQSILRHGITFPFFIWQSDGTNYILDGTQRDRVLLKLVTGGYECPPLPCALIDAKDRKEAAEKILLISSQYGKMTEESLDQFLAENDLSFLELADELELPSLDEKYFKDPNEFAAGGEDEQGRLDEKKPVKCPECGHQFVP